VITLSDPQHLAIDRHHRQDAQGNDEEKLALFCSAGVSSWHIALV
jgi:hypothetical protein